MQHLTSLAVVQYKSSLQTQKHCLKYRYTNWWFEIHNVWKRLRAN